MDLSPTLITARLVTLVVEVLLLGLAWLLTLSEFRRAKRPVFQPLLTALTLQVLQLGTVGILGTVADTSRLLFIPPLAICFALLQSLVLLALLTYYFRLVDPTAQGPGPRLARIALYVAITLATTLAIIFYLPTLYGSPTGATIGRLMFAMLDLVLTLGGLALLQRESHPFRTWMSASLIAFAIDAAARLALEAVPSAAGALYPLALATQAVAIMSLVAVAFVQVTADLTAIAQELQLRAQQVESSATALRTLHAGSLSLLRAGSVRACLTAILDVLAFQLGFKSAVIVMLEPEQKQWAIYRLSGMTGQATRIGELPFQRKLQLTEAILAGAPLMAGRSPATMDQDFLTLTAFSKHLALVPLAAPRVSYSTHGEPGKAIAQRGSAWKTEPCWNADRVCMQGLGNFPQRLDTCRRCPAFEPLGALAVDLRGAPVESRPLEVLETLGFQASLALRDITQLEELITDIRFRTAALDPLPLGIVLLGPDGRITAINRVVRQLAGTQAAGWLGMAMGEVPLTTKQEQLRRITEEIIRQPSEELRELQVEVEGPQGVRLCALRIQPLVRAHVLTGILLTLEDKTETRELQKTVMQQEQFAALGQLAMGIAHEVNNPIAGVSGLLQVLAQRLPSEAPEQRPIQTALNDLKRASDTIRNLLQFARAKPSDLQPVDLNELVREVVDLQMFHPLAKDVTVTADLAPDLPLARTDRESLAQVLTNLFVNALQAMGGAGTLEVGTFDTSRGLMIAVRDSGPGIPSEILSRIFEPFFSTKKAGQGTGLGLSLCEMILGDLSASMAVWSLPGATEFLILLPREPVAMPTNGSALPASQVTH